MLVLHPILREGLAEEHMRRLADYMGHGDGPGAVRRLAGRLRHATGPRHIERGPACANESLRVV